MFASGHLPTLHINRRWRWCCAKSVVVTSWISGRHGKMRKMASPWRDMPSADVMNVAGLQDEDGSMGEMNKFSATEGQDSLAVECISARWTKAQVARKGTSPILLARSIYAVH